MTNTPGTYQICVPWSEGGGKLDNGLIPLQAVVAWLAVVLPIIALDVAALKWGVVTSGDRGGKTYLEI